MSTMQTDEPKLEPWRERAPSAMEAEEATLPRILGFAGIFLFLIAVLVNFAARSERLTVVPPLLGNFAGAIGLALLLFHAISDKDAAIRRTYCFVGFGWLLLGLVTGILQKQDGIVVAAGVWIIGLLFVLASLRHEDDIAWRTLVVRIVGGLGALLGVAGTVGGSWSAPFLLPYGMVFALVGLGYLWATLELIGTESDAGHRAARIVAWVGVLVFVVALARSVLTNYFFEWGWLSVRPEPYFVPTGLLLMVLGALYAGLGVGLSSDRQVVVLTRREINAYFFSPIAYLVFLAFAFVAWILFIQFVGQQEAVAASPFIRPEMVQEPIIRGYLLQIVPLILMIMLGIPVITMRLFSEEHRMGTHEVLMTANTSETAVVLSKFIAAMLFYMLIWLPFALNLLAFRIYGKQEFEYRPMLAFFLMQAFIGAGFISMGLFFSSLTSNQIVAAVLTAGGILGFLMLAIVRFFISNNMGQNPIPNPNTETLLTILDHMSIIEAYAKTLDGGVVAPRYFIFYGSMAVFWLFGTTKVIEARKWM